MRRQNLPAKKTQKKKRPKWAMDIATGKRTLQTVAVAFIKYMELATAARKYLEATNRFNQKLDYRLYSEVYFIAGALEHMFHLKKSFIADVQYNIKKDKERWEKEVKDYCQNISPEKSLIATGPNMEAEMAKIIQRDKMVKNKGGKVII